MSPRAQTPALFFEHFFIRKVILVKYPQAFVVMPGGLGTLDEAFETATLIQTGKNEPFPIIAMGNTFWQSLREFPRNTLLAERTISPADLELITLTDTVDGTMQIINEIRKA